MKKYILFVFIFFFYRGFTQKHNDSLLFNTLAFGRIEKLSEIRISKTDLIKHLSDIVKSQMSNKNIFTWYSSSVTDSFWMSRNESIKIDSQLYVSIAIKSLYWIQQICNNIDTGYQNFAIIENIKSKLVVYDCLLKEGKMVSLNSIEVSEIFSHFVEWYRIYEKKGLKFVKKKNIYPLPQKFKFIVFSTFFTTQHNNSF
jgi:hypothetical protein